MSEKSTAKYSFGSRFSIYGSAILNYFCIFATYSIITNTKTYAKNKASNSHGNPYDMGVAINNSGCR